MAALIELSGYFIREFWRSADGAAAGLTIDAEGRDVAVFGEFDPNELTPDLEYRFVGSWGKEKNGIGKPFNSSSYQLIQPHTRQGVTTYLVRAAEGLGFGPVRAAACYDEWGQHAVEHCRTHPGEVVELLKRKKLRFDLESAQRLAGILQDEARLESCSLQVLDLLTGLGFPRATVREAVKAWGARAAFVIRRDPYKLMRFRGCGFKRCDAMYLELGLPPGRLKRQALAAWYAINRDSDGHTWYPLAVAEKAIHANIAGADVQTEKALRLARLGRLLSERRTDGPQGCIVAGGSMRWVSERRKADNEREIAAIVAVAMGEDVTWPA